MVDGHLKSHSYSILCLRFSTLENLDCSATAETLGPKQRRRRTPAVRRGDFLRPPGVPSPHPAAAPPRAPAPGAPLPSAPRPAALAARPLALRSAPYPVLGARPGATPTSPRDPHPASCAQRESGLGLREGAREADSAHAPHFSPSRRHRRAEEHSNNIAATG